ncbi:hypothetical protein [Sporosarcina sp. Te-1]|uniref:hypothetical protein n=1 Tax=Sporosarcina sp. Te-1 TaxID=2818390 RepID=UPI001A9EA46C|nr:hypothetical protein [Sporosarcina sp. Te-1]QTD40289.1 hypothetical protein J3U78_16065 [Sporosarcina sp. Te-1]
MEKLFIFLAIISFLLSASLFVVEVVKNGFKNSNFKPALILFLIYVVSVISFLIVYNN